MSMSNVPHLLIELISRRKAKQQKIKYSMKQKQKRDLHVGTLKRPAFLKYVNNSPPHTYSNNM